MQLTCSREVLSIDVVFFLFIVVSMLRWPASVSHNVVVSVSEALSITEQEANQVGGDGCA